MSELVVKNLSIQLKKDGRSIVRQLSFSLQNGESLVLLGQSGCGKTISCRAIMGLLEARIFQMTGSISFGGTELKGIPERKRRAVYGKQIAFIPQNPMTALDPSMRVGRQMDEMLRLHTDLSAAQRRKKISEVLEQAGLSDNERICRSYPHTLSGGMLQRVLIAMALSTEAELILADEPTTALDVVHRNEIVDAFIGLRENGAAVLFVTHDFAAAMRLGGDALIMYEGSVVERGKTRDIYSHPGTEYTKALVKAASLSKGERYAGG